MMYLDRPVFPIAVNWRDLPIRSFRFDLGERLIGFGKPRATPVQNNAIQGFEFSIDLVNETQITEFESFTEQLRGSAVGFWFPNPQAAMDVIEWIDEQIFIIKGQQLRNSWNKRPDIHLLFVKEGEAVQFGKIQQVTTDGDREVVHLTEALPETLDESWEVYRLQYVRMASDTEEAVMLGEQRQQRRIRVVELPEEYGQTELGERPIYLYKFWLEINPDYYWWFTSFEQDFNSNGQTYLADAITHGEIRSTAQGLEETTVKGYWDEGHPLTLSVPFPVSRRMGIQIIETKFTDPDAQKILFTGKVMSIDDSGEELTARCASFLSGNESLTPGFLIQPRCNYDLGDPSTCRKDLSDLTVEATITGIGGVAVVVTATGLTGTPKMWFALGTLETGEGAEIEVRSILASGLGTANKVQLRLDFPLLHAEVGSVVTLVRGCDGTKETCKAFGNFLNWGGHFVPLHNLSLKAIEKKQSGIGKK